jgi:hypothetical protein
VDSENQISPEQGSILHPNPEAPTPGYQPSTGRKLFMFLLCLCALIAIWAYYWFADK